MEVKDLQISTLLGDGELLVTHRSSDPAPQPSAGTDTRDTSSRGESYRADPRSELVAVHTTGTIPWEAPRAAGWIAFLLSLLPVRLLTQSILELWIMSIT